MKDAILNWMKKNLAFILAGIFIFCMIACFVSGCQYHKHRHPCPEPTIVTNTVIVTDPYWHHIADSLANLPPKEKIKWLPQDTLFTPTDTFFKDIDTAAILKNHYSIFRYHWYKLDTGLLELNLYTTISQNKPLNYEMDYKILKPTSVTNTTVDNSVTFTKYIYLGGSIPIKNIEMSEIELLAAFKRFYIGTGYIPQLNSLSFKGGATLFKFK